MYEVQCTFFFCKLTETWFKEIFDEFYFSAWKTYLPESSINFQFDWINQKVTIRLFKFLKFEEIVNFFSSLKYVCVLNVRYFYTIWIWSWIQDQIFRVSKVVKMFTKKKKIIIFKETFKRTRRWSAWTRESCHITFFFNFKKKKHTTKIKACCKNTLLLLIANNRYLYLLSLLFTIYPLTHLRTVMEKLRIDSKPKKKR